MSRAGWTVRSNLWLVVLIALGLGVAVNTWRNFQRGSAAYHRYLAAECERMSERHRRWCAKFEAELKSGSIRDPALAAEQRLWAIREAQAALTYDTQAAILAGRADLCEQSPMGWIALHYQTARNPPNIPVWRATGRGFRSSFERISLPERIARSAAWILGHLDYFGLMCLTLAIIARRTYGRPRVVPITLSSG